MVVHLLVYLKEMKKRKLFKVFLSCVLVAVGGLIYCIFGWTHYKDVMNGYEIDYPIIFQRFSNASLLSGSEYDVVWSLRGAKSCGEHSGGSDKETIKLVIQTKNTYLGEFKEKPDYATSFKNVVKISGMDVREGIFEKFTTVGPFLHKDKVYTFYYSSPICPDKSYHFPDNIGRFNRMLGSFRFLD